MPSTLPFGPGRSMSHGRSNGSRPPGSMRSSRMTQGSFSARGYTAAVRRTSIYLAFFILACVWSRRACCPRCFLAADPVRDRRRRHHHGHDDDHDDDDTDCADSRLLLRRRGRATIAAGVTVVEPGFSVGGLSPAGRDDVRFRGILRPCRPHRADRDAHWFSVTPPSQLGARRPSRRSDLSSGARSAAGAQRAAQGLRRRCPRSERYVRTLAKSLRPWHPSTRSCLPARSEAVRHQARGRSSGCSAWGLLADTG